MNLVRIVIVAGIATGLAFGCGSSDKGSGDNNDNLQDGGGTGGATTGGQGTGATATGGGGTGGVTTGGSGGIATGGTGGVTGGTGGVDASTGATGGSVVDSGTDGGGFQCGPYGEPCIDGSDCCSGTCDPGTSTCTNPLVCANTGESCQTGADCCSLRCENNLCQAAACISDGAACTSDSQCCGNACDNNFCTPLNLECRTAGNSCSQDLDCCSNYCLNGTCELLVSFCVQFGDICTGNEECCTANCVIAAGNTVGTCGDAPAGATNCAGKIPDGGVCTTCGDCCSRLCAPSSLTGRDVCQAPSGCHINGDFCRVDSDCCGGTARDPSDPDYLPGDGNVVCEKDPGAIIGVCRNPNGCTPQGSVCHYNDADYVCGGSSSRNNCCQATGFSDLCEDDGTGTLRCGGFGAICPIAGDHCSNCQLDTLGVPRCQGLGSCRAAGETCSSSADCCNQLPCVPDDTGVLRCLQPVETGPTCVPSGGSCTIDADCCVGTICIHPVGSTQGTCGVPETPDGGTTPTCAQYGQTCSINSDCCNSVPCTDGVCKVAL